MKYYSYLFAVLFAFQATAQPAQDSAVVAPSMTFLPDWTFKGNELAEWKALGNTAWHATDGELRAQSSSGKPMRGWLVSNQSYQDIGFRALFKCEGTAETGLLFRLEQQSSGYRGIYLSLKIGDVGLYAVTLDADGNLQQQEPLRRAGGIWYRLAPPPEEDSRAVGNFQRPNPPDVYRPISPPNTDYQQGVWNQIEVFFDLNTIRAFLNDGREIGGAADAYLEGYGPVALYAAGEGSVQFKDVGIKDIALRFTPDEETSAHFKSQRISDMYYSWGADAADFNRDGHLDVISGPNIFYGPDFTTHREIFPAIAVSPSKEFTAVNVQYTYDFNGDGWPDVLVSPSRAVLYLNPGNASRRWAEHVVIKEVQTEITDFKDIDGDGKPELIYGANGSLRYAKPDGDDPTRPWKEYRVSEDGYVLAHGIGTGDINGDGKLDILGPYGWWEQPATLEGQLWNYHPVAFGRYGHRGSNVGGAIMAVYDVNGDGLNDVVTSLNVHGFGFAWFEQQRDGRDSISFVRHMISDDYSRDGAGGVTFSQAHGATFADVDGDGVLDFIVGKRYFTHLDNYYDPDPYGPPVLYWYRTVRNPDAPGGAEFVPELIHNRSGAGSEVDAIDLNGDGRVDIITATNRGTFIFWNQYE
ncbi:FG-GAP-like repeat-containing protein [Parapedobacter koreensis]|uniref:Repeat domain-containing protein n=1 Tax=Parapedobacter koreensis TaxID=332977 RepID=A0A1H7L284_9SPHI|nr:FG-GAP-like repeat-containing protein [Parapedobacter koreensis]SEK93112.1 Repeat domain-containing protein [Parapedobacter koreensis]